MKTRRSGILDQAAEKFLDKLLGVACQATDVRFVAAIGVPCLILQKARLLCYYVVHLIGKVPPLVSLADLMVIWPLMLGCLVTVTCGLLIGAASAWALNLGAVPQGHANTAPDGSEML